jgi:DNA-binding response OmpR family regulator
MNLQPHIMLLDNDPDFCSIVIDQLQIDNEFIVSHYDKIKDAVQTIVPPQIDLILVSSVILRRETNEITDLLGKAQKNTPVILLQDNSDNFEESHSANIQFVIKTPFRISTLITSIIKCINDFEQSDNSKISVGPYLFIPKRKLMLNDNLEIRLTDKETAMISYLYFSNSGVVCRDELLHAIWGYNPDANTHTLETHIYRLRQKIEKNPSKAEIIVTEERGYRLNA